MLPVLLEDRRIEASVRKDANPMRIEKTLDALGVWFFTEAMTASQPNFFAVLTSASARDFPPLQ